MEFYRVNRVPQRLVQVSTKIDKGIETFIHPGKKFHCRIDETFMKSPSRVCRKIPLELVDENEAVKATETPLAEVDEDMASKCRQDLRQWKSRPCHGCRKQQRIPVFIFYHSLCVAHSNRSVIKLFFGEIRRCLETQITHINHTRRKQNRSNSSPRLFFRAKLQADHCFLALKEPCQLHE